MYEIMTISSKDMLESIYFEGNPILNDDKETRQKIFSSFRNLKLVNGINY